MKEKKSQKGLKIKLTKEEKPLKPIRCKIVLAETKKETKKERE
jgi:hypothetical protein